MEATFSLWIPLYLPLVIIFILWWRIQQLQKRIDDLEECCEEHEECCEKLEKIACWIKGGTCSWGKEPGLSPWVKAAHAALCNLEEAIKDPTKFDPKKAICYTGATDPTDPPTDPPPF